MRKRWTEAERELITRLYPHTSTQVIAQQLGRKLGMVYQAAAKMGLKKTEAYLSSPAACRLHRDRGEHVGKATQFKPGQKPFNKGLRRPGWAPGRMASTQFKAGERVGIAAANWCPLGTIRPDNDGYLRIKVREGAKGEAYGFGNTKIWPLLQRHVWEQEHGTLPAGHAVVFKDGNRSNCAIDNLECISRRDLMLRNSSQRWGKEVFEVIQLRGALNRKLRTLSEKQNDGSAQPSL